MMKKWSETSLFEKFAGTTGIGFALLGMTMIMAPEIIDKPANQIANHVDKQMTTLAHYLNPNVPLP